MPEKEKPKKTPGGTLAEIVVVVIVFLLIALFLGGLFGEGGMLGSWWEGLGSFFGASGLGSSFLEMVVAGIITLGLFLLVVFLSFLVFSAGLATAVALATVGLLFAVAGLLSVLAFIGLEFFAGAVVLITFFALAGFLSFLIFSAGLGMLLTVLFSILVFALAAGISFLAITYGSGGFINSLVVLSFVISSASFVFLGYYFLKLNEFIYKGKRLAEVAVSASKDSGSVKDKRWEGILKHIESEHPNDWKVAIMEADVILSEMLDRMNYLGESIGEKLKNVERSDFLTLDKAWEAHKIRNNIAHSSESTLSHREAKRAIKLYEDVFKEFHFV